MSMRDILQLLDVALPEELLGLDIPGTRGGRDPGFLGMWAKKTPKIYSVYLSKGAIRKASDNRIIGYTSQAAKKKYKTKRRSKRLTKRDMYIIEAMKEIAAKGGSPGTLAVMLK